MNLYNKKKIVIILYLINITFNSSFYLQTFWRSCSFILGYVMERAFKSHHVVQLCSFPAPNGRVKRSIHLFRVLTRILADYQWNREASCTTLGLHSIGRHRRKSYVCCHASLHALNFYPRNVLESRA